MCRIAAFLSGVLGIFTCITVYRFGYHKLFQQIECAIIAVGPVRAQSARTCCEAFLHHQALTVKSVCLPRFAFPVMIQLESHESLVDVRDRGGQLRGTKKTRNTNNFSGLPRKWVSEQVVGMPQEGHSGLE